MSRKLWVSTLAAPLGAALVSPDLDRFYDALVRAGGILEGTEWREDRRVADISFIAASFPTFLDKGDLYPFDVITQEQGHRQKKILIADMESTIIEQEMLDCMASRLGFGEEVASITRQAMRGELDFGTALRARLRLFRGQKETLLHDVAGAMTLMPGAARLVAAMKAAGGTCWLVSGGLTFFVRIIAERLGFDRFYGNELLLQDGLITGEVALPLVDKESKRRLLNEACGHYGVRLSACLAVGDGANDIPMLEGCHQGGGLAVAYHAKPKVREIIPNQINHTDLSSLIYAQNLIP